MYKYSNILRKTELDSKICYLTRTEGSPQAFIEWQFDLELPLKKRKALKKIDLKFESKCFENGKIQLKLELLDVNDSKQE